MNNVQNQWYILMGDQKYGPYDYKTMIQMVQSNQLMDYNYAWASHLEAWTQIHQLEEFSKDRFQNILKEKDSDLVSAFIERRSARKEIDIALLGHNTIRFFDGKCVSISESGGLCLLNTPLVQVGDQLKLHFKAKDSSSPAFNVEAEVVRKNFSKQRLNSKSGLYYAVRFLDIQPVGVKTIHLWVNSQAS